MSENYELQLEEEEALLSIYYGDPAFKQVSQIIYQYKCGAEDSKKSILLEIEWPPEYPSCKPKINLDTFYNNRISQQVKSFVLQKLDDKATQYLGDAVTFTLIELVKDNLDTWWDQVPNEPLTSALTIRNDQTELPSISHLNISESQVKKPELKKGQMSKAQKRKQWDRCDAKGDKPRGWNWVDIIKHLSSTGSKSDSVDTNA